MILDGRWCDYKVDKVVYDVRSEHQHVMILNTMDFGNLLVLDGYANLAESDTVQYTHSLMNLPEVRLRNMVYIQHIFRMLLYSLDTAYF